jgi:hypothetical protein
MGNYEIRSARVDYGCIAVCLRPGSCCARYLWSGVSPQSACVPSRSLQPAPFEFRGIRIGDEIKEAERRFLAWKVPSLSSKPGLCGSDGIKRIETCTDVLDTGEYVNMTMLDRRVAQIYMSTDSRTQGNTYNSYVLALAKEYGSPDKLETRPSRNGLVNEGPGDKLRWSKNDQYIKANRIERSVTIGSEALDTEMDALEKGQHI